MPGYAIVISIIAAFVLGGIIGVAVGYKTRKARAEKEIGSAEEEACRMEHTISDESFQKLKEKKQGECPFAETCTMIAIRKKKDGLNSS